MYAYRFSHALTLNNENQMKAAPDSILYTVPYFTELEFDLYYSWYPYGCGPFLFQVDWNDKVFKEEMIRSLTPKN